MTIDKLQNFFDWHSSVSMGDEFYSNFLLSVGVGVGTFVWRFVLHRQYFLVNQVNESADQAYQRWVQCFERLSCWKQIKAAEMTTDDIIRFFTKDQIIAFELLSGTELDQFLKNCCQTNNPINGIDSDNINQDFPISSLFSSANSVDRNRDPKDIDLS